MKFTVINGNKGKSLDSHNSYYEDFMNAIQSGKSKKDRMFLKGLVSKGVKAVNTMDTKSLLDLSIHMITEIGFTIMEFTVQTMALLSPEELNEIFPNMVTAKGFNTDRPVGDDDIQKLISKDNQNEEINLFFAKFIEIIDIVEMISCATEE